MLDELRNELKTSLEHDDVPTIKLQEDKDIDRVLTAIESSQQAIRSLIKQIRKNNEWFNKYGVATTLEYYDFSKEEIKTAIEKYDDKKIHSALNKKFIDKINKFFGNILNTIVKGFKKILGKNNNDLFEEHINKIINELKKEKNYKIDYDKCNNDIVKDYLKKHENVLKIAVLKGAKTLSGAQYKIITEFYNLQGSLHYTSLLLDNINITTEHIINALTTYATGNDLDKVTNKLIIAIDSIIDTVEFISKYKPQLPKDHYWYKLNDIKNPSKDDIPLPLGLDNKSIYGIDTIYSKKKLESLKKLPKKPSVDDLKPVFDLLTDLWKNEVFAIDLDKLNIDVSSLEPKPLVLKEYTDIKDLYSKVYAGITDNLENINNRLNELADKFHKEDNIVINGELYDRTIENVLLTLINYRNEVYNNTLGILLGILDKIIGYYKKLPVVLDYAELSTKCYTKEG